MSSRTAHNKLIRNVSIIAIVVIVIVVGVVLYINHSNNVKRRNNTIAELLTAKQQLASYFQQATTPSLSNIQVQDAINGGDTGMTQGQDTSNNYYDQISSNVQTLQSSVTPTQTPNAT